MSRRARMMRALALWPVFADIDAVALRGGDAAVLAEGIDDDTRAALARLGWRHVGDGWWAHDLQLRDGTA